MVYLQHLAHSRCLQLPTNFITNTKEYITNNQLASSRPPTVQRPSWALPPPRPLHLLAFGSAAHLLPLSNHRVWSITSHLIPLFSPARVCGLPHLVTRFAAHWRIIQPWNCCSLARRVPAVGPVTSTQFHTLKPPAATLVTFVPLHQTPFPFLLLRVRIALSIGRYLLPGAQGSFFRSEVLKQSSYFSTIIDQVACRLLDDADIVVHRNTSVARGHDIDGGNWLKTISFRCQQASTSSSSPPRSLFLTSAQFQIPSISLLALRSQPLSSACPGVCDQDPPFVPPSTTQSRHSSIAAPRQLRHSCAIATDICAAAVQRLRHGPTSNAGPNCRSDVVGEKRPNSRVRPLALPFHVPIGSWRAIRRNANLLSRQPVGSPLRYSVSPRKKEHSTALPPHAAISSRVGPKLQKPGPGLFSRNSSSLIPSKRIHSHDSTALLPLQFSSRCRAVPRDSSPYYSVTKDVGCPSRAHPPLQLR
ncbi:hypothetical protein CFIO01_00777 [Colletotrichum fioriniae PJ7]|uniref:Uncharacterized protein n=1 Tax=Colletotrichum fioriniae PJ7 TaxID=1445577 RepID=A0A010R4H4_9PEZI|nr:hypothetical protein CFIO01_00777 [Colletotrichum fioriniae PJ7]